MAGVAKLDEALDPAERGKSAPQHRRAVAPGGYPHGGPGRAHGEVPAGVKASHPAEVARGMTVKEPGREAPGGGNGGPRLGAAAQELSARLR
jgi:hypothetical protein